MDADNEKNHCVGRGEGVVCVVEEGKGAQLKFFRARQKIFGKHRNTFAEVSSDDENFEVTTFFLTKPEA